jgi:LytS/YehU family sensor histidine kinase
VQYYSIPLALLDVAFSAVFMIAVTNFYRQTAHKRGWLALPPTHILPVVVASYLVLVAVYMLHAYLTYAVKMGGFYRGSVALGALAGGSRYVAIWLLAFHLYHYARQAASQRATIVEARLTRLSNDLNPHFLFNALNGIRALTREDPARSRDAIDRLSSLLRYSLTRSNQFSVPLTEEVVIIKEYLALEKIRLEERLTVSWKLPDDYADCEIPPLSLHTLVDNAVKHGIATLPEGGTIDIMLRKTAVGWEFTIHNPCSFIPDFGTCGRAHKSAGTGIKNLRQRLLLQYGKTANLDFHRTETFAIATLTTPLMSPPTLPSG